MARVLIGAPAYLRGASGASSEISTHAESVRPIRVRPCVPATRSWWCLALAIGARISGALAVGLARGPTDAPTARSRSVRLAARRDSRRCARGWCGARPDRWPGRTLAVGLAPLGGALTVGARPRGVLVVGLALVIGARPNGRPDHALAVGAGLVLRGGLGDPGGGSRSDHVGGGQSDRPGGGQSDRRNWSNHARLGDQGAAELIVDENRKRSSAGPSRSRSFSSACRYSRSVFGLIRSMRATSRAPVPIR